MLLFIRELFTDSLGRPEPKLILGIPLFIVAVVYTIITKNLSVGGFFMGTALSLLGVTAVTDALNDKRSIECPK